MAGESPPTRAQPQPPTETEETSGTVTGPAEPSPEDQPGGAGDEEPIRSEARFELSGGRFSPREVRVPPFFAIQLVVVPDDGKHEITVEGPRESYGGEGTGSYEELLEGLRPDRRYTVRDERSGATAEVVASAEPGP